MQRLTLLRPNLPRAEFSKPLVFKSYRLPLTCGHTSVKAEGIPVVSSVRGVLRDVFSSGIAPVLVKANHSVLAQASLGLIAQGALGSGSEPDLICVSVNLYLPLCVL